MAKATIAKLIKASGKDMLFQTTNGNHFYVKAFECSVLVIEPFIPMTIYTLAEIIAGCFENRSTFRNVKEINFTFNDVNLSVTKDHAEPRSIVKRYFEVLEKRL